MKAKKVDFMIIGAAKSGTTSLANHLAAHPEVCFCGEKEPEYFSHHNDWQSKIDQYHALYHEKEGQLLGEASTSYTMIPENEGTHERLYEYNPDLKLIYLMRDPVKRMISHFGHNFVRKRINRPLEDEVRENPAYVSRSSYFTQIKPYIDTFGTGQIKLFIFEEFIKDPQSTLIETANFLGIDADFFQQQSDFAAKNQTANRKILPDGGAGKLFKPLKRVRRFIPESLVNAGLKLFGNSIPKNPEFPTALKAELYQKVKPEIEQMEGLMNKKLELWKAYN